MTFEIGDIVAGQYRLDSLLGEGGMGAVYRATHVGLAESVALKVVQLPPGQPSKVEELFMKRFEREARVAFKFRHPNAVSVLDFGEDDGAPYLVMEFLEGQPLEDELSDREPLEPLERLVRIARQLADALVAMHNQSLVHRDLKPANVVMIEGDDGAERPVIVDFGLAYLAESETLGRVTQPGEVLGTPMYISPEQGSGDAGIGPPSDVYSFGCVLFEMLTGRVPFTEGSPSEMVSKHLFVPPPSVLDFVDKRESWLYEPLAELVAAMIAKDAGDRPSAEDVREMLGQLEEGETEWPRGRPERFLRERSQRAVDDGGSHGEARSIQERGTVGIVGTVEEDWYVSLGSAGIDCEAIEQPGGEMGDADAARFDVVFIPDADVDTIEEYEHLGAVLAGCDPSDFEASTALLQTSALDVVPQPLQPSELVSKVKRAIRKTRRRGGTS